MEVRAARGRRFRWRLGLFLAVAGLAASACGNSEPFRSAGWKAGDQRQRGRMVKDLVSSQVLVGKSKAMVADLLGPPDSEDQAGLHQAYKVDLGMKFGSNPWLYQLHVEFSGDPPVAVKAWYAD